MRAFAAVFAREIAERRMVFLVGLCCGVPTLVASALHGWSAPGNAEVRLLAATVGGGALAAALALLYGASMIAGETAEKRISFYFSRPLPDAAIWAGKLLAAVFLSFSAGLLVFLPGWLTGPRSGSTFWGFEATPGRLAIAGVALVIICVLVSHALVTVARLRSPWVALDLLLAPALVILAVAFLKSLLRDSEAELGDASPAKAAILVLIVTSLLALLAASFVQVAEGRTDGRRAHGAFSTSLWGILGVLLAAIGLFTWWVASGDAQGITHIGVLGAAPRGAWVEVGGPLSAGRGDGNFLVNPASGSSLRIHGALVDFSQDGSHALWSENRIALFEEKRGARGLYVADLSKGRPVAMSLGNGTGWGLAALSPSGLRLVARNEVSLAAFDISDTANPKQLAAWALPWDGRTFGFVDENTIRVFPRFPNAARRGELAPSDLEITEFSLRSKKFLVTGRFDREALPFLRVSADGRLFVGTKGQCLEIYDGKTGKRVATLVEDLRNPQLRLLTGSRIAVAGISGARAQMKIFLEGEEGRPPTPTGTIDLGPAARVVLGGEIAPGRVALALLPFKEGLSESQHRTKLTFVDIASGTVSAGPAGLVPATRFSWWLSHVMPPAEAGAPWTSLFLDASGRLVRLDPTTGTQTVLLGKGK